MHMRRALGVLVRIEENIKLNRNKGRLNQIKQFKLLSS